MVPELNDARRISILFVNTPIDPPLGADTWVHAQIMGALDRSAHELHAACVPATVAGPTPTFELVNHIEDLSVVSVDPGPRRPARLTALSAARAVPATLRAGWSMVKLARYIRRHHIDVLHTSDRPRDALACVLLSKVTRARSIVHVHVVYADWMGSALRWSIRHADARIAVSEFVKLSLTKAGLPAKSTHVVLNAIELSQWTPGEGRDEIRREFCIGPESPVVVTVCRLFREKGSAELIVAVDAIRREFPNIRLLIVGQDPDPGQSFRRELGESVRRLELEEHVRFVGRRSDVSALMAAADVFAMPSFEEPFGLVFAEAMAMELPIVALDNGGTKELIVHGVHGLLSAPGDAAGLADNLSALLRDPDMRLRMGVAGRHRVEAEFTVERLAAATAIAYRRVV